MRHTTTRFLNPLIALLVLAFVGQSHAVAQENPKAAAGLVKPTKLLSFIMLADSSWPSSADLNAELQKSVPDYRPVSKKVAERMAPALEKTKQGLRAKLGPVAKNAKVEVLLGAIEGRLVLITFVNAPNPVAQNESFIRAAWWWRSAYEEINKRKSHVIITITKSVDARRDQLRLAQLTAAVISKTNAIGVIWATADAIFRAKRFSKSVANAKKMLPVDLAVSVKLGRDTEFPRKDGKPAWLAMTYGLRSMGLKEIEYRGFSGEPVELVKLLLNTSSYLMSKGDVVQDNETIGSRTERQYVFKVLPSSLGAKGKVLRMQEVEPGKRSVRPNEIFKSEDIVK